MDASKIAVMRKGEVPTESYGEASIHWLVNRAACGSRELTLGETTLPPGGRNPLHRHPNCEEAMYVLEGEIEHVVEGTPNLRLGAGEAICIPRNLRHQAINIGVGPARLLVAFSSPERETRVD